MRLLAPLVAALLLAGCAGDYSEETAAALQARVVTVTDASAAADWATATTTLRELVADVTAAREAGLITEARYDNIMAAVELVQSEIDAAIAAVPPPSPDDGDDQGEGNNGNGNGNDNGNRDKDKKDD